MSALAPTLMVQGTASSVGKSLLVAALCRLFRKDGLRVAPFKSQNMALNSAVTPDGLEIGRAQAVQAEAAGIAPSVLMNPILLKPEGHRRAQVVLLGKPAFSLSAAEYHEHKPRLWGIVEDCLGELRRRYDLVIIEGAGSPAEINLKDRDIVNMSVARLADAPVLLVGDIDRGGVFAAFVGTLELLEPDERDRVRALVINKFRGDIGLLEPGLDFLRRRTEKPVLGVLPFLSELRIADEDSLSLERRVRRPRPGPARLDVVVVRLPRISNYDDVAALEHEADVCVRFAESSEELTGADLVILPGTKSTVADLAWLRESGIASALTEHAAASGLVLGICGGCQMLGRQILDPLGVESAGGSVEGLGLLELDTHFEREKTTAQVVARVAAPCFLTRGVGPVPIPAYEIHMGQARARPGVSAPFQIETRNGAAAGVADGAINAAGNVVGTLLHGLLEHDGLRGVLIAALWERRGQRRPEHVPSVPSASDEHDRLEAAVRRHLDVDLLRRLARIA
ncbi:MAG TPA: cobyric acid synthase [Polyangiaceae bacterium]|nr:cobyric acid synthase [Polyangiaceae bacterium]